MTETATTATTTEALEPSVLRIHVSGLPQNVDGKELEKLIAKVCPVLEVHLPEPDELGFRRNFGIVRVQADKARVQHCIKSLSGSNWKGSKIRLDLAREWYRDRLQREREEEQARARAQQEKERAERRDMASTISVMEENLSLPVKEQEQQLRHVRALSRLRETLPLWSRAMIKIRRGKTLRAYKICATPKIAFKDSVLISKSANKVCRPLGQKTIFDDELFSQQVRSEDFVPLGEYLQKISAPIPAGKKASATPAKTQSASTAAKSSAATVTSAAVPASTPAAATTPAPAMKIGGKGRVGFGTLLKGPLPEPLEKRVDCCIEDDEPCKKRSRTHSSKVVENDFEPSSFDIVDINDDTPCVPAEMLEDEALQNERNRALTLALSVMTAAQDKQAARTQAKNQNKKKTDTEKASAPVESVESTKDVAAAETPALEASAEKNANVEKETTKEDKPVPPKNNQNFVNLGTFKDIFHKDGGVWWNANEAAIDGSTHVRGELENDVLFREAEKMGFDVRQPAGGSIFNFGGDTAAPKEKAMMFNFFGSSEPAETAAKDTNKPTTALTAEKKAPVKAAVVEIELVEDDIIVLAKTFCRESPLEELHEQWRNEKDDLIADFKKRRRDAKRWSANEKARRRNMLKSVHGKKKSK